MPEPDAPEPDAPEPDAPEPDAPEPDPACRISVVTVVAGRHDHLRAQRRSLAALPSPPHLHVVVALGDPAVRDVLRECPQLPTQLIERVASPAGLAIAAARNAGAVAALDRGTSLLVFLDVDCLAGERLLARYAEAARDRPDGVFSGPVTYLPPTPPRGWSAAELRAARAPHPARPDPPTGQLSDADPALFWSLSFAVRAQTWRALGGFYEGYLGYGAEDTDFGLHAAANGARLTWVGGADAFHQHHPSADPPVQHLDDIVRNAAVFVGRHGVEPMPGWLAQFRQAGLIVEQGDGLRRTDAVRVATIPARHDYLDAVLPQSVVRHDPARTTGWEPDPLFDARYLEQQRDLIDLVHLHFGFDHLDPTALQAWIRQLRRLDLPLVYTVHDLRNPHHVDPARHDAALAALVPAAAELITLTPGAARECRRRFGRTPRVIGHPTQLREVPAGSGGTTVRPGPRTVLVPLKAMRANVIDAPRLVAAVHRGAHDVGARTRVLLHPPADAQAGLADVVGTSGLDLDVRPYLDETELLDLLRDVDVCVLPQRWGTHSGWVESCADLGVRVVAPDCGYFTDQAALSGDPSRVVTFSHNEATGLDENSLVAAVRRALAEPAPAPAARQPRLASRDIARAEHDVMYRTLARPAGSRR